MRCQGPLGRFAFARRNPNLVADSYPGDPKNPVDGLNIPFRKQTNLVRLRRNLAHFQCAGECAEQSTGDSGNHVVESRRPFLFGLDPVEFLDAAMNAVSDRFTEMFDICMSNRPLDFFETHVTGMN